MFALRIAFASDPDEGQAIKPEVSVSWGSFQIWVGGRNLCAHLEEGERITSVHWYLLPLMEWFARYWNPLFHEERLPVKNDGISAWESLRSTRFPPQAIEDNEKQASKWEREWQAWWTRHALRAAREGGLFPDVLFRRLRDSIEVSWGTVHGEGMPYRFDFTEAPQGAYRLLPRAVTEPLHDVLSSASEYLVTLAGWSPSGQSVAQKSPDTEGCVRAQRKASDVACGARSQREGCPNRMATGCGISVGTGRSPAASHAGDFGVTSRRGRILSRGTDVRFSCTQGQGAGRVEPCADDG